MTTGKKSYIMYIGLNGNGNPANRLKGDKKMKINNEKIEKIVERAEDRCEKWRIVGKNGSTSDIDDRADIWLGHPAYNSKDEAEDSIADLIERGKIDEGGEGYTAALMKPLFAAVENDEEGNSRDVVFSDASLESVVDAAIHAVDGGNYRDDIDIGIYPDAVEPDGSCELHAYVSECCCVVEYRNYGFAGQTVDVEDWIALDTVVLVDPRTYKDCPKVDLGESDIASLTIRSGLNISLLRFGEDGSYSAYECIGDGIEIGAHYTKIFTGFKWLTIYDDNGVAYNRYAPEGFTAVDIYRAGEFGCIIHWRSEKKIEVNATITDEEAADLLRHSSFAGTVEREKEEDAWLFGRIERWYDALNGHVYATVGNFPFKAVYDLTDHDYADTITVSPASFVFLDRGLLLNDFTVSESEIAHN